MSRHHAALNRRRWNVLRRRVLSLAGFRCAQCGRPGRMEVDHVVPMDAGGEPWAESNLQALCGGCHRAKSSGERGAGPIAGRTVWLERLRKEVRSG